MNTPTQQVLWKKLGSCYPVSLIKGLRDFTSSVNLYAIIIHVCICRIRVVPKLHQLQHDLGVFLVSAVKDLTKSIEQLEKARSEYRAAMLWLRNASGKLDDPDTLKQLTKFREV